MWNFENSALKSGAVEESLTNLENQVTNMCNQRDATHLELSGKVKASFGDDSSHYEMVGGHA